jgi:hypothetical protein
MSLTSIIMELTAEGAKKRALSLTDAGTLENISELNCLSAVLNASNGGHYNIQVTTEVEHRGKSIPLNPNSIDVVAEKLRKRGFKVEVVPLRADSPSKIMFKIDWSD